MSTELEHLSALAADMESRFPLESCPVEISLSPKDIRSLTLLLEKVRAVEESSFSGVRISGCGRVPDGNARVRMADGSIRNLNLYGGAA